MIYLLFLLHAYSFSAVVWSEICTRDYNYKESHTNKFEQTRSGISLPTNLHLSCASVHVREGLWKSSSMSRYECVHIIEYVWLLKKRRFSQTSQKFNSSAFWTIYAPWTHLSRLRILRTTICSFEQRTQTVRLCVLLFWERSKKRSFCSSLLVSL